MPLSSLQKYILLQGLASKKRAVSKAVLNQFYHRQARPPQPKDREGIITKSVERLINRGLVKILGFKTAEKWFIKEVILTSLGKKAARQLLGRQEKLPLKLKK